MNKCSDRFAKYLMMDCISACFRRDWIFRVLMPLAFEQGKDLSKTPQDRAELWRRGNMMAFELENA